MVAAKVDTNRRYGLVEVLSRLIEAHEALLDAVEAKIAAMRSADTAAISKAMQAEHRIMGCIREEEAKRLRLTEGIARGYGIGSAAAVRMTATRLADRIGGDDAARIRESADRLRSLTTQIARRNHVAQLISQNVLRHIRHVFVAMTGGDTAGAGYARTGTVLSGAADRIFDAVG